MNFDKKMELMRQGSRPIGENSVGYVLYTNADMEQNDPNHPDYVKNRPFYKEAGTTVTWDGEPTGVSITFGDVTVHKVSDYIPKSFAGCEVTMIEQRSEGAGEITATLTDADVITIGYVDGQPIRVVESAMVAAIPATGTVVFDGENKLDVEAGLYFPKEEDGEMSMWVSKMVCGMYTKKLDPAFLPFRFYNASETDVGSIDFSDFKPGEIAFLLTEEISLDAEGRT